MKNFKFLSLSFLFITLCAFQCEDDQCPVLEDFESTFELQMSSTESSFSVGDEIVISSIFSSDVDALNSELDFSIAGMNFFYDFELFEVQADNQPVGPVGVKIVTSALSTLNRRDLINNDVRIECEENCSFELKLELREAGYYGIVFRDGDFVNMVDCFVYTGLGEKSEINNFGILNEIGTQTLSYEGASEPMIITPSKSFFFKVE